MRIITDSAADFTNEELQELDIRCVRTQVLFGDETFTPGVDLSEEEFWQRLMAGEDSKTSQPSPQAFLDAFEDAEKDGEEVVYISISSALSGTIQSANIAASMMKDNSGIHIVNSLCGAAAQKLLVLHACKLRSEGMLKAREIANKIEALRSRVRLLAGVDTLENLGRSGRIPRSIATLGKIAQLKPLLELSKDGRIVLAGKAIGRRKAIEQLVKKIASYKIDRLHPMIPFYSHTRENCNSLLQKLKELGIHVAEEKMSAIGTAIAPHIGPGAYGVTFIEAE